MALEWTQNLAVGVTEIDNQHKELFRRVNLYLDAMTERKGKEEIGAVIKFLENYVVTHFGTEERYMTLYNYPDQRLHREQHAAFIKTFNEIRANYNEHGASVDTIIKAQKRLGEWLRTHIPHTDKNFADFLKAKKAA